MVKVKVKFLGALRSAAGSGEVEVELGEGANLRDLLKYLRGRFPELENVVRSGGELSPSYLLFVNDTDAELLGGLNYVVKDGDVIVIVPVTHGGSGEGDVALGGLKRLLEEVSEYRLITCVPEGAGILQKLEELQTEDCVTQLLPKPALISARQVILAAYLTMKAFRESRNISRKKYLEFLLYFFGNRQIREVISALRRYSGDYTLVSVCRKSFRREFLDLLKKYCRDLKELEGVIAHDVDCASISKFFNLPEHLCTNDPEEVEKLLLTKVNTLITEL